MAEDKRFEARVSVEWLGRVDGARGAVPRGAFVKLLVDEALSSGGQRVVDEAVHGFSARMGSGGRVDPSRLSPAWDVSVGPLVRRSNESAVDFKVRQREAQIAASKAALRK